MEAYGVGAYGLGAYVLCDSGLGVCGLWTCCVLGSGLAYGWYVRCSCLARARGSAARWEREARDHGHRSRTGCRCRTYEVLLRARASGGDKVEGGLGWGALDFVLEEDMGG